MGLNILTKARAISELVRLDLVIGAGIFVVAGEIFGLGGFTSRTPQLPSLHRTGR